MSSTNAEGYSAFFYGTLMAPQVLHRVTHGSTPNNPAYVPDHLSTYPAILPGYRRHRVRHADYPAILPLAGSSVRGTYVTGLRDADLWRLDIFEGSEYAREKVKVRLLTVVGEASGEGNVEGEGVQAEAYVWISERERLEDGEWDFEEFQREKMRFWVGIDGEAEYDEVDAAVAGQGEGKLDGTGGRGANGHIAKALENEQTADDVSRNAV